MDGTERMITKTEAFSFLKEHKPMPCDDELKENEIKKYEEVREYFISNPNEWCILLFLNSFGGKDEFGVYQMMTWRKQLITMKLEKRRIL